MPPRKSAAAAEIDASDELQAEELERPIPTRDTYKPSRAGADMVKARVTKAGDGKVSTGEHVAGEGDIMHEKGAIIDLPKAAALALEERAYVEIQ